MAKRVAQNLRDWAKRIRQDTYALALAYRDPRVPWYARAFGALVVVYAFSPIDLIPDIIPVLGYLDDLLLVPLGIALAVRMIPPEVMAEARLAAAQRLDAETPGSRVAVVVIVLIWITVLVAAGWLIYRRLSN